MTDCSVSVGAIFVSESGRMVPSVRLLVGVQVLELTPHGARVVAQALCRWADLGDDMAREAEMGTLLGQLATSRAEGTA